MFQRVSRGVLVTNGTGNNDLMGLTAIVQIGLPTSPNQFAHRVRQPSSPGLKRIFYVLAGCEADTLRKKYTSLIPSLGTHHHIDVDSLWSAQVAIAQTLASRISPSLKNKLKVSLPGTWRIQGVDVGEGKNEEEVDGFWQLIQA
jgi:hypothetical protein